MNVNLVVPKLRKPESYIREERTHTCSTCLHLEDDNDDCRRCVNYPRATGGYEPFRRFPDLWEKNKEVRNEI